eukprot:CAMPEP_0172866580 /NCGR_PEP_ID=MMETSP1075-20121228/82068_1 /TAXON_ID=2916 /ORGANISM="Ceratium fusus, Strain PA161109" /LENGTH=117 /DNA_ID=CAMNT_0013715763 /DNA_START=95 /DNA_END=448 /DNA_ORIENTATION=+
MPPGGGIGMTSISRETSLPDLVTEIRRRHAAGPVCIGRPNLSNFEAAKGRDLEMRKTKPQLFFDSRRHIDRLNDYKHTDPGFNLKLRPSMSAPKLSTIARAAAGSSEYTELLEKLSR